jgi:hypothetical protein
MKTFRLITAMVLVAGLMGGYSAFGAEQTTKGKKGGGTISPEVNDQVLFVKKPDLKIESISYEEETLESGAKTGWIVVVVKNIGPGYIEVSSAHKYTPLEMKLGNGSYRDVEHRRYLLRDLRAPGSRQTIRINQPLSSRSLTRVSVKVDPDDIIDEVDDIRNNELSVSLPIVRTITE